MKTIQSKVNLILGHLEKSRLIGQQNSLKNRIEGKKSIGQISVNMRKREVYKSERKSVNSNLLQVKKNRYKEIFFDLL